MAYSIIKFVADHCPTQYVNQVPIGTQSEISYESYNACKADMDSHSKELERNQLARKETVRAEKSLDPIMWISYKMYTEEKQPKLLHYIDNNYPVLSLPSVEQV